jgi:hypothetical protein
MGFNADEWSERLCSRAYLIRELADWDSPAKAHILGQFGDGLESCRYRVELFEEALRRQDESPIPDLVAYLPSPYREYAATTRAEDVAEYCVVLRADITTHPRWGELADERLRDAGAEATFTVYVPDSAESDHLVRAVEQLGRPMGYGDPFDALDERGSRWRRWRAKANAALQTETADKVAYALELAALRMRQAEVSATLATAAESLCRSLGDRELGIARAESVLVLKYPIDGKSAIIIRQLSTPEILVLERYPEIERFPTRVLDALAAALSSDPDDVNIEALLEGDGNDHLRET